MTLAQVIDKPVEEVFNVVVEVTSFRRRNPPAKSARKLNEGRAGEETGLEFEVRGFGELASSFEFDERGCLTYRHDQPKRTREGDDG